MAIDTGMGISITQVTSTQQAPLGQTVLKPAGSNGEGEQVWIYVQASEALVVGNAACRKITAGALNADLIVQKIPVGAPSDLVVGVAQHAFTANYYGWLLKSGQGQVLVDSGNVVGGTGAVVPGANAVGTAEAGAATANGFGVGIATTAVGLLAPVVLNCPAS
jgi:hypothetical protein